MKIVFISTYLSIHQLPFCEAMHRLLGDNFFYIANEDILPERLELGYPDLNNTYSFVIRAYEDDIQKSRAIQLATEADVAIIGSAPMEFVRQRLKRRKLTFCYSERLYKQRDQRWKLPVRTVRMFLKYGRHKQLYLLCASAYTAGDFAKTFTFLNKAYKWGYFPEAKRYDDIEALIGNKEPSTILWAGRFIDWKHPEHVIDTAQRLKAEGYDFRVSMIGNGELHSAIEEMIQSKGLDDRVSLLGSMSPDEVRAHMEKAQIYLFTSDRQEGWGAVLNESMNSGCAVIASDAIGAAPFLLEDGKNGMIYKSGNVDDLYQKVKLLLMSPDTCRGLGKRAYTTITEIWNAQVAAQRLLGLCDALLQGEKHPRLYDNGPCSKAVILNKK